MFSWNVLFVIGPTLFAGFLHLSLRLSLESLQLLQSLLPMKFPGSSARLLLHLLSLPELLSLLPGRLPGLGDPRPLLGGGGPLLLPESLPLILLLLPSPLLSLASLPSLGQLSLSRLLQGNPPLTLSLLLGFPGGNKLVDITLFFKISIELKERKPI